MVCFERFVLLLWNNPHNEDNKTLCVLPCRLAVPKAVLAECLSSSWNIPLSDSLYLIQQRIMSAMPCCHAICHDDSFNVDWVSGDKTKNSRPSWDRSIVYLRYHPNYRIIKHGHSLHILSYVRPVTEVSVAPKISPDDILGLPSWVHSQAYVSLPLHRPATLCHTVTGATTLTHRFNIFCVHYIRRIAVCQVLLIKFLIFLCFFLLLLYRIARYEI